MKLEKVYWIMPTEKDIAKKRCFVFSAGIIKRKRLFIQATVGCKWWYSMSHSTKIFFPQVPCYWKEGPHCQILPVYTSHSLKDANGDIQRIIQADSVDIVHRFFECRLGSFLVDHCWICCRFYSLEQRPHYVLQFFSSYSISPLSHYRNT